MADANFTAARFEIGAIDLHNPISVYLLNRDTNSHANLTTLRRYFSADRLKSA